MWHKTTINLTLTFSNRRPIDAEIDRIFFNAYILKKIIYYLQILYAHVFFWKVL